MGLEALSRGASSATFIENDRACIQCIRQNLEKLQIQNQGKIFAGDIVRGLEKIAKSNEIFDIIYADPPYHKGVEIKGSYIPYGVLILKAADEGNFMKEASMLFIEESHDAPVHQESLKSLQLKSTRRFGRSVLYQYIRYARMPIITING